LVMLMMVVFVAPSRIPKSGTQRPEIEYKCTSGSQLGSHLMDI
jgi:hypothetical protein